MFDAMEASMRSGTHPLSALASANFYRNAEDSPVHSDLRECSEASYGNGGPGLPLKASTTQAGYTDLESGGGKGSPGGATARRRLSEAKAQGQGEEDR